MQRPENIIAVVREWLKKADNDLKTSKHILKLDVDSPTDTICFHAQQCVEKYIKALMVFKQIPFPKSHNLSELLNLLPIKYHSLLSKEEQQLLTVYATVTRYPGDYEDISLSEAKAAVRVAGKIRKAIRVLLPKEALTQIRKKS
ncbi:MAG: HEPN domain-containing protein [Nitrospirae bacterium]|nr:HEPN domain-containing protein [Nitrospirota bacterium]